MKVIITEFLTEGTCEVSGKTSECLKAILEPNTPPAVVSPAEFIKLLRFQAQQEAKRAAQPQPPGAPRDRTTQATQ